MHIESLHESIDGTCGWERGSAWRGAASGSRKSNRHLGRRGRAGRNRVGCERARCMSLPNMGWLWERRPAEDSFFAARESAVGGQSHCDQRLRGCEGDGLVRMRKPVCAFFEDGQPREIGAEWGFPGALGRDSRRSGRKPVGPQRKIAVRAEAAGGDFVAQPGLPESTNTYPTLALDPAGRLLAPTITAWPGRLNRVGNHQREGRVDLERYFGGDAGPRRIDLDRLAGLRSGALAGLQRVAELGRSGGIEPRVDLVDCPGRAPGGCGWGRSSD